jgi:hypothetical protein
MGCKTLHFFSPVQTGLPRELAKSLTRAMKPGLVSPGGSDQAQRSDNGDPLRDYLLPLGVSHGLVTAVYNIVRDYS